MAFENYRRKEVQTMANKMAVAGPNSKYKLPDAKPAGFWAGFWHGSIAPIAFIVGLFNPGIRIYETNNNGAWYDLGFILGASSSLGGGGITRQVTSRKECQEHEKADDASDD
jgi:hypothetical protein